MSIDIGYSSPDDWESFDDLVRKNAELRRRVAELEAGLQDISQWKQEDEDDHELCKIQWRGCVAIAKCLLNPPCGCGHKETKEWKTPAWQT